MSDNSNLIQFDHYQSMSFKNTIDQAEIYLSEQIKLLNEHIDAMSYHAIQAYECIVNIGNTLRELKAELPHGQFLKWRQSFFGDLSISTQDNFMHVSERMHMLDADTVPYFSNAALYELARKSIPDNIRELAIKRAALGIAIDRPEVRILRGHEHIREQYLTGYLSKKQALEALDILKQTPFEVREFIDYHKVSEPAAIRYLDSIFHRHTGEWEEINRNLGRVSMSDSNSKHISEVSAEEIADVKAEQRRQQYFEQTAHRTLRLKLKVSAVTQLTSNQFSIVFNAFENMVFPVEEIQGKSITLTILLDE